MCLKWYDKYCISHIHYFLKDDIYVSESTEIKLKALNKQRLDQEQSLPQQNQAQGTQYINDFMVYLLEGLINANEEIRTKPHVYLAKCNLRLRIKCVGFTKFENKEWEFHFHGRLGMGIPIP